MGDIGPARVHFEVLPTRTVDIAVPVVIDVPEVTGVPVVRVDPLPAEACDREDVMSQVPTLP
jgi:hypothetical protein